MDLSVFSIDRLRDGVTKLQSVVDSKDTTGGRQVDELIVSALFALWK